MTVPDTLLQEPAAKKPKKEGGLPRFRPLAAAAFAANVPLLSWLLLTGQAVSSLSLLAGLLVGLAMYGSLYLFIGRALEPLFASLRGQAKPNIGGAKSLFIALLPLKYLLLGGLMFLLIRGGHLSIGWFAAGFVTTQVAVTAATVMRLARPRRSQLF